MLLLLVSDPFVLYAVKYVNSNLTKKSSLNQQRIKALFIVETRVIHCLPSTKCPPYIVWNIKLFTIRYEKTACLTGLSIDSSALIL